MADREELRRLAAEINNVIAGLHGQVAAVLARIDGWEESQAHHREYATRVMAVVAPTLAEKMQALDRMVADVERIGQYARGHWEAANRLRGELVVALMQRDDARANLSHAVDLLGDLVDPNESARRFVEAHREVTR